MCSGIMVRMRACIRIIAAHLHPELDIYCFESSEVTREKALKNNVCELDNVNVVPYALADESGMVSFQESGTGKTINSLSLTPVSPTQYDTIEIEAQSAKGAVEDLGIPAPDTVKIDVEGAEYRVLQGFTDDLFDRLKLLIVELHHIHTKDLNTVPYLKRKGFNVTFLAERRLGDVQRMQHIKADSPRYEDCILRFFSDSSRRLSTI